MKSVAIIQARLGSTRLPGKVLLDLGGKPMLTRVVERVRRSKRLDEVMVATTGETRDDALADFCVEQGWRCFRGSEHDVLDRYYRAAQSAGAGVIVRITSDCPLIDPLVIDRAIELLEANSADYCANVVDRTFPRGLDVEAFTFAALEKAWRDDTRPEWREHVTQYILRHPDHFRLVNLAHQSDHSGQRWTVDTPEDFAFVQSVYADFGRDDFSWEEALTAVLEHPEWSELNRHVEQKII